ncbi:UDP-N-acetylmuramoyl-L-alanine--D-glutamate ligase [Parendozoicomonas sp. Alg238-R29]|uniref:UDP-N-acetylmuramoyl-L-alanine--D-glutamate ligase n=1 Tax=Parendozoicomonas sp. Alg238-R29 TaxID=2993446 RepID=UPI00248E4DA0|nr:UDP-N-acetylmuramoyl-L-alanine--D-glutamate ligase [Parendozoicomonas sp. Alg238-R29]
MSEQLIGSDRRRIVIGLGKTGLACARWLYRSGSPFRVFDTRVTPPGLDDLHRDCPGVEVVCGELDTAQLCDADELIVSPGLSLKEPAIAAAIASGVPVSGDIELFCRALQEKQYRAPVVAITGSNGKSTVTTLLGQMAQEAGVQVGVGGNIGTPVLKLLEQKPQDLYVLELSSFQLETTHSLRAAAATVLNVTPDHMDRYESVADYHQAKHRIYRGCYGAVRNRDDALTSPLVSEHVKQLSFGFKAPPGLNDFGAVTESGETWLVQGVTRLIRVSELKVRGLHNQANALAALALGSLVDLPMDAMLSALREFTGLAHRCEWLADHDGVSWFNDSKATNTGAAVAAIEGLGADLQGDIVLIAGGDGKGADFTDLRSAVDTHVRELIVLGADGGKIAQAVNGFVNIHQVDDLEQAVILAGTLVKTGDAVLLAPACASFDMFRSYEHRGDEFRKQVGVRYG